MKQGYLLLENRVKNGDSSWERRWFTCDTEQILIFKSMDDQFPIGSIKKAAIEMCDAKSPESSPVNSNEELAIENSSLAVGDLSAQDHQHIIEILVRGLGAASSHKKTVRLAATDISMMQEWVSAIKAKDSIAKEPVAEKIIEPKPQPKKVEQKVSKPAKSAETKPAVSVKQESDFHLDMPDFDEIIRTSINASTCKMESKIISTLEAEEEETAAGISNVQPVIETMSAAKVCNIQKVEFTPEIIEQCEPALIETVELKQNLKLKALMEFTATNDSQLSFAVGDVIEVCIDPASDEYKLGYIFGTNTSNQKTGWFIRQLTELVQ